MLASLTILAALTLGGGPAVDSVCQQIVPAPIGGAWVRTPNRTQAVVLLQGFHYHALGINVAKAELRGWQKADSTLAKELGKTADVFVFAYGQNVPIDVIVKESKLAASVADLRRLGYDDVVLVGHSAGGLIARHFVEDFPKSGVTKVVQVCTPNGGSPLANLSVPKSQKPFVECLTEKHRQQCLVERAEKTVPKTVQFVCVVAKDGPKTTSDGVVPCNCQWTADLQAQGIPAVAVVSGHREVVHTAKAAEAIARVVRTPQPRWSAETVDQARPEILGPPPRPGLLNLPRSTKP